MAESQNTPTASARQESAPIIGSDFLPALPAKTSPSALTLPESLPFEEWQQIGQQLGRADSGLYWYLGDWWRHGIRRYGQRPYQCESWCGLSYKRLENIATTCKAFEFSRRRENLSFTHHTELAALPAAEADRLLDWAEEVRRTEGQPPSARTLREKAQQAQTKHIPVQVTTVPITAQIIRLIPHRESIDLPGHVYRPPEPPQPPAQPPPPFPWWRFGVAGARRADARATAAVRSGQGCTGGRRRHEPGSTARIPASDLRAVG